MKNKDYANFIIDQLAGDPDFQRWVISPAEEDLDFWQMFLLTHPDQLDKINTARRLVYAAHGLASETRLTPARKKELHDQLMKKVRQENRKIRLSTWSLSAAAAVLLLIVASAVFWQRDEPLEQIVISTPYGQTEEILLPDGSSVVLNANSTLSYPKKWEEGLNRQVWLKGEAHFTVTPQPATQAKFTVVTEDLSVNVLGTVFNVHAREQGTRVTLEEGKVTLQLQEEAPEGRTIEMEPGEQVLFSAQTRKLQIEEKVDIVAQHSWKDGVITFDGITLGQLGEIIEETFGMQVAFQDSSVSRQLITGAGPADDLSLLLETVEGAFGIRIVRRDSLLIFGK